MAQEVKIAMSYLRNIVWALIFQGIIAVLVGILILLNPPLLVLLAGLFFIVSGLVAFLAAYKINKYTVIKFKL